MNGIVAVFNREKSFGFIQGEDNLDYSFHISHFKNYKDNTDLKKSGRLGG